MHAFDFVFGSDDKPAPSLAKLDAPTETDRDDHPFAQFFQDTFIETIVGGADGLAEFKRTSSLIDKKLRDGYQKIADTDQRAAITPIASIASTEPLTKASAAARKVRRNYSSGNTIVDEFDVNGNLVRTFIEKEAQ